MDLKKLLVPTLVGTVVFFLAGWIIWGIILQPMQAEHTQNFEGLMKETENVGLIAAAQFFTALLWTIIYGRWAGIKTFATGAKAGVLIAVISGLSYACMMIAMMNLTTWTVAAMDAVGNAAWGALGGGAIGWALGFVDKET